MYCLPGMLVASEIDTVESLRLLRSQGGPSLPLSDACCKRRCRCGPGGGGRRGGQRGRRSTNGIV